MYGGKLVLLLLTYAPAVSTHLPPAAAEPTGPCMVGSWSFFFSHTPQPSPPISPLPPRNPQDHVWWEAGPSSSHIRPSRLHPSPPCRRGTHRTMYGGKLVLLLLTYAPAVSTHLPPA